MLKTGINQIKKKKKKKKSIFRNASEHFQLD